MYSAYAYLRISTEDQSNFSLEAQEEIIKKYAASHHFNIIKTYTDDGVSAKNFNRPAWKKLELDLLKSKGEVRTIIVAKYDRLIRNAAEGLTLLERFEKSLKVQIISAGENFYIDPHSPYYFKIRADMFVNAEFERRVIADRTKMGIWQAKRQGRFLGTAPFGYKNARDANNKPIIVLDQNRASIIQQLFENVAAGMDWKQAGKIARKNGFTNTRKDAVKWVLNNILYAGIIEVPAYGREPATRVKGIHEPIISEATFHRAQSMMYNKSQPKQELREEFPLRGIIKCKECDRPMTGGMRRGRLGTLYPYYNCNYCKGQNYNADKAHQSLLQILHELSLPEQHIRILRERAEKVMKEQFSMRVHNAEKLRNEIRELETKIDQLEERYITGKIEDSTFQKFNSKWKGELAGKLIEAEQLTTDESKYWQIFYKHLYRLGDISSAYDNAALENKRRIIEGVFNNGFYLTKQGYETPQINPILFTEELKINNLRFTQAQIKKGNIAISLSSSGDRT